jgi:predicted RNA-binding Zn-ribbon protein involved in translation (DUF1610 family)
MSSHYELGTIEASEDVLADLYINLRRAIAKWAAVTNQTPQARMGYIGQHLTSVVTGFPGGRSGARGKDLVLPDDKHAEIKTCYRVDQLGSCSVCQHAVASIELVCPACGSNVIDRKDDSKWLLTPKSITELEQSWESQAYYFVLFDFADLRDPRQINARIWEVDPRSRGFAYCLVDYFFNIRANSASSAPFNLWPFSLKFALLGGELIYSARIDENDAIETFIFPALRGTPTPISLDPMPTYARSTGLTNASLALACNHLGLPTPGVRADLLRALEAAKVAGHYDDEALKLTLAEAIYGSRIQQLRAHLPAVVQEPLFT